MTGKAEMTTLGKGRTVNLSRRELLASSSRAALLAMLDPMSSWGSDLPSGLEQFSGRVAVRNDIDYKLWRDSMMWQFRKSERQPDMILQANNVEDVVTAVNYARSSGQKITTRAGGHSMSASFLRDGGILLDVSRLQELSVNAKEREVTFGPGVIGRGVNEYLKPHGLAVSTAHCGMVPLSGFLLGGGVGWNGNAWGGMGVFNINAVDIVTADGKLLHASTTTNPDLFWAVRGGGPGLFGVVIRFYVKCFPLPQSIQMQEYIFPFTELANVLDAVSEIGKLTDDNVELLVVVTKAPPEIAAKCTGQSCDQAVFVSAIVFDDSVEIAERKLTVFANHPILEKLIGSHPMTGVDFESLYYGNELPFPQKRWQADNVFTDHPAKLGQLLVEAAPESPTDTNAAVFVYKGKPEFPEAAYTTSGEFYFAYYMVWDDPADDVAVSHYHRNFFKKAQKLGTGSYISEFNQEGRPEDLPLCFTTENWRRLAQLRTEWDPGSVFHNFYGQS